MPVINSTFIIADDLTGANDTALQYFNNGLSARIIIDPNADFSSYPPVDIWAISTESRNIDKQTALERVLKVVQKLKESLNAENFYKKIDSTLRGNTGVEIAVMLEILKKDVVIVAPAYIEEGRTTIGAYQLLEGTVIERTQCALDPKAPIYESYIPDILKKDLNSQISDLIGTIGLNTVTKGAGPIVLKINELVQKGKKIIVSDAASVVDLEQIALAIQKSNYDILPAGSAGLAKALNKIQSHTGNKLNHIQRIPNLSRLIVSGSATQLTLKQIQKLKEQKPDTIFVDLTIKDIMEGLEESENILNLAQTIADKLSKGNDVVIHSSFINKEMLDEDAINQLIDAGIAKDEFSDKITDYLSDLVYEINSKNDFILIILGGETSFKCTSKIKSIYLEVLDAIMPAIPLCIDINGKIVVTKSGNFGDSSTLCKIIEYFNKLKDEKV